MKTFLGLIIYCFTITNTQAQTDSSEYLLKKLINKTINESEKTELRKLAFLIQNTGQSLEETQHAYSEALQFINRAIQIFGLLQDTVNEANNRKHKGYLLARLNRFEEGKYEIQQAIVLFHSKKVLWGVAVSQFNFARLYELENKSDSAIIYVNLAIDFWKEKNNNQRVFLYQNLLIHILTKSGKLSEAKKLQSISTEMAKSDEHHWQGILDFYVTSANLFNAVQDHKSAKHYKELYSEKLDSLKKEGIPAMSYFTINLK